MITNIILFGSVLLFLWGLFMIVKYHPVIGLAIVLIAGSAIGVCLGEHWALLLGSVMATVPIIYKTVRGEIASDR